MRAATKARMMRERMIRIMAKAGLAGGLSLGLIGNASGKNADNEVELDPRRFR